MMYVCAVLRSSDPSITGAMTLYTIGEDALRAEGEGTKRVGYCIETTLETPAGHVSRHFYSTVYAGELHDWWAREFGEAVNSYVAWATSQGDTPNREDH